MFVGFQVKPYSIDNLKQILAECSQASLSFVNTKSHIAYFKEYFEELKAKTIIIEKEYVDHDFLEDFSNYYVKCFQDYERRCTRLHFFKDEYSEEQFWKLIVGSRKKKTKSRSKGNLQDAYLGFIVVKPLPQTIIGRTCLRTYPEENRRRFPIVRNYEANLFGIPLNTETLAFQEQDSVAAACATSALWSVFQGTGKLFQHPIPSPVEITKQANILPDHEMPNRSLPSEGLTPAQMAQAIRSVSLEPLIEGVSDIFVLKGTLYAYLRGKIPLILCITLYDISNQRRKKVKYLGRHAVAITGYSLGGNIPDSVSLPGSLLKAYCIDKIYVHDDQVGPFARMNFDGIKVSLSDIKADSLSTSFNGSVNAVRAVPDTLIAPVYHKIRIPFNLVHDAINSFDAFIEDLRNIKAIPLLSQLVWDIYLTTVNDFKKDIIDLDLPLSIDYRKEILMTSMPRFIWRASAYYDNKIMLDLLFDATDIEQGLFFIRAIEYEDVLSQILHAVSKTDTVKNLYQTTRAWGIFEWFGDGKIPDQFISQGNSKTFTFHQIYNLLVR